MTGMRKVLWMFLSSLLQILVVMAAKAFAELGWALGGHSWSRE